jgi:quinol:cytochrome c oxidoreductase pentaheme cytochrome subunit
MKVIPSRLSTIFSALLFALIITPSLAQDAEASGDPVAGKQLFNQNCAACHALNRKMTGPALANVEQRLYEDEGLDKDGYTHGLRIRQV